MWEKPSVAPSWWERKTWCGTRCIPFFSPPYLCHNKNIQRLCKLGPSSRLWEFLVTRAKVGRGFISVLGSKQLLWISSYICIVAFIQREIFQVQKPVVNTLIIQQLNIAFPLVPPPSHKKHSALKRQTEMFMDVSDAQYLQSLVALSNVFTLHHILTVSLV